MSRSRVIPLIAVLTSCVLGVGLGLTAHELEPRFLAKPSEAASEPPQEAPAAPSPSSSATSATSATASGAPAAESSEALPPTRSPADERTCVRSMFPSDSFSEENEKELDFVCTDTSYVKLAGSLKGALVNAGGGKASGGMKEWSNLGIYSLAASAVIRGRCCPDAPTPSLPDTPKPCDAVSDQLAALAKAAKKGAKKEDAAGPLAGFEKSVRCIIRAKHAKVFGDFGELQGGERTTFAKTLARTME